MIQITNSKLHSLVIGYSNKIIPICQKRADFINAAVNYVKKKKSDPSYLKKHQLNDAAKAAILQMLFKGKRKSATAFQKLTVSNHRAGILSNLSVISKVTRHFKDADNLRKVIECKPSDISNLQNTIDTIVGLSGSNKAVVNKILNKIFDYAEFSDFAYDISEEIGTHCCPYCNRAYIKTVKIKRKKGKSGIRPTFDHFISKSESPMFALSFYNLIPSCYHCNSSLKHTASTSFDTHLHPYVDGFGKDVRFSAKLIDLNKSISDPQNIQLEIKPYASLSPDKRRKIFGDTDDEGNVNLFGLNEVYQMHRDVVGDLIMRTRRYNLTYAGTLQAMFGNLNTSKEEFYRFYFGNYLNETDFHKRPLSKLSRDIISEELSTDFGYS